MSEYRAYYAGSDGHFKGSRVLNCDSDTTAISSAKKLLDGNDIEIWEGLRKTFGCRTRPGKDRLGSAAFTGAP